MIQDNRAFQRQAHPCGTFCRLIAVLALAALSAAGSTNLFTSGIGGYNTYRIPALYETRNGTLLAFCEGRKNSASDSGDIDTILRRSFDGGLTWTAQQVIWSDGANTCGNPTVVKDSSNDRLWLFMTWNNGNDTEAEIENGTSIDVRKIYSCYSDDNGATWSAPVNRFGEVQPANTRWDATGPGCGIQMVNGAPGRLIIPANNRNIQSDDHGVTWGQSASVPGGSSESQEVEISGGVLLRNDRATGANTAYHARIFCRSSNQGASWAAPEIRQDLACPICQASTIVATQPAGLGGRMLVFSNPSSTTRDHMTIQYSLDDGLTWPYNHLVYSGSSAYSCLAQVGTNSIGLLYERDNYGKITFDTFAVAALVPIFQQQTWSGGAGPGKESWQQPENWVSNSTPFFNNALPVVFQSAGAASLTNCIGDNVTLQSLVFNSNSDSDVSVYLAEKINSPATNYVLTFDSASGTASNIVASGATGNFTIGFGGAGGWGSISLAADLVIDHEGSGELKFDRPISGPGGIIKNGSGILYLRQSNPYTGSTVINAGVVVTGGNTGGFGAGGTAGPMVINGGTLCNSTSAARPVYNNITVGGNFSVGGTPGYGAGLLTFSGTVDFGGVGRTITVNSPVTFSGSIRNGGFIKAGTNLLTLSGTNTYTGQNIIYDGTEQLGDGGGTGSLDPASTVAIGPAGIFQYNRTNNLNPFANTLSGIGTLVKANTGEWGLTGTNSFSGTIDVQQGKLGLSGAACVNGVPAVNVAAAGTLSIGSGFLGGFATIGNLTGSGKIDPVYGQGTGVRTLQVNQSNDAVFSGVLSDGTSGRVLGFTKNGAATLVFSGTNSYTGPTTISNGTLLVDGALGNSAVVVKSGATLGGHGSIGGAIVVENGGILSPGNSIGTLYASNSLMLAGTTLMEINASNGTCDHIQGVTSITYGGTLVVSNLVGTLTNGQSFNLFNAPAAHSGNFSHITPGLPYGQAWSFNPANGLLTVISTFATYPTNLNLTISGGTLSLAWPVTHLGWIAQSNSVAVSSASNWFDIPGTSAVTNLNIIPSPAQPGVFYRLRSP